MDLVRTANPPKRANHAHIFCCGTEILKQQKTVKKNYILSKKCILNNIPSSLIIHDMLHKLFHNKYTGSMYDAYMVIMNFYIN